MSALIIGLVVLLIFLVLAGVAVWYFFLRGEEEEEQDESSSPQKVPQVTPPAPAPSSRSPGGGTEPTGYTPSGPSAAPTSTPSGGGGGGTQPTSAPNTLTYTNLITVPPSGQQLYIELADEGLTVLYYYTSSSTYSGFDILNPSNVTNKYIKFTVSGTDFYYRVYSVTNNAYQILSTLIDLGQQGTGFILEGTFVNSLTGESISPPGLFATQQPFTRIASAITMSTTNSPPAPPKAPTGSAASPPPSGSGGIAYVTAYPALSGSPIYSISYTSSGPKLIIKSYNLGVQTALTTFPASLSPYTGKILRFVSNFSADGFNYFKITSLSMTGTPVRCDIVGNFVDSLGNVLGSPPPGYSGLVASINTRAEISISSVPITSPPVGAGTPIGASAPAPVGTPIGASAPAPVGTPIGASAPAPIGTPIGASAPAPIGTPFTGLPALSATERYWIDFRTGSFAILYVPNSAGSNRRGIPALENAANELINRTLMFTNSPTIYRFKITSATPDGHTIDLPVPGSPNTTVAFGGNFVNSSGTPLSQLFTPFDNANPNFRFIQITGPITVV